MNLAVPCLGALPRPRSQRVVRRTHLAFLADLSVAALMQYLMLFL
jgi:hypothetical protein